MPAYDYKCDSCNEVFEVRQSIKDDPLTTCELCGAEGTIHRVISGGLPPIIRLAEGEIKTLGHLAARHSDEFSADYKEHLERKNTEGTSKANLPSGMKRQEVDKKTKPWWDKPEFKKATDAQLKNMTPKEQKNYILEGQV